MWNMVKEKLMKTNDLTNIRFGKLVVISKAGKAKDRHILWHCKCDCGRKTISSSNNLRSGGAKSCGCLQRETARKSQTTHGKSESRLMKIYYGMRRRCFDKNDISYKHYGGRGISIYDEWKNNPESFYDWAINNGYLENSGLSIDRIDNNGNYEPSNCRWATRSEQMRNTRRCNNLTIGGITKTVTEWALEYKTSRTSIKRKVKSGKLICG